MSKLPLVSSDYPEEVNMISFKRIMNWEGKTIGGFQYDDITDDMIRNELESCNNIDLSLDWEDDPNFHEIEQIEDEDEFTRKFIHFHTKRIAAIVKLINTGGGVHPVELDTFCADYCCSCILNGHHRIRALQYLRFTHFPANCSGIVNLINKLVNKNVDKRIKFI